MGAKVDGVESPAKVDTVANPAKVYGVEIGATDIYWPVAGVTKPQHLWPFSQTGDYTDQGSTGGFTLSPAGSGNSFSSGLVLNGSGWATRANHADLCDVGATFSVIFEGTWGAADTGACGGTNAYIDGSPDGWYVVFGWSGAGFGFRTYNPTGTLNTLAVNSLFTPGTNYQVVATLVGGTGTLYVNGAPVVGGSGSLPTPTTMTGHAFAVGAANEASSLPFTGTIKRVGVLKGEAWSAVNIAAIYAASLP